MQAVDTKGEGASEAMPKIVGEPCPSPLDGPSVEHVGILEWYNGPLAEVFRDEEGLLYAHWCDQDDTASRWAVVRITVERLRALGDGIITMRDLLTSPDGEAWLVDLANADNPGNHDPGLARNGCVRVASFPEGYLPDPDSHAPRTTWFDRGTLEAV